MCGFVQRDTNSPAITTLLKDVGLNDLVPTFKSESGGLLNFYPAFGNNPNRQIKNLIISPAKTVNATWWYDCSESEDTLIVGKRTTFNARNLSSSFWKGAIRHRRAIVIATAVGESKRVHTTNEHYLMQAENALLLGAVHQKFDNGCYSTAVITRPPHDRFSKFHDKAIPFFLPHNKEFIEAWLSDESDNVLVMSELDKARIHTDLKVTKVKNFKGGEALGDTELLTAD